MTIDTRSFSPSSPTSSFIAVFSSGSLFASLIEPDTSSRNTRLLAGRSLRCNLFALQANAKRADASRVPRALRPLPYSTENGCLTLRLRIVIPKIIHQLLDPHGYSAAAAARSSRNRRMLAYDAVSTSIENVDSGCCSGERNGFSMMRSYSLATGSFASPSVVTASPNANKRPLGSATS